VRVISGYSKGRSLKAALPDTIRPTSDRVKEAMFDILGSLGGVEDLVVVDLFCGSGALGIEALSRGAQKVLFVDEDPAAIAATRQNLIAVGLDDANVEFKRASVGAYRPPPADLIFMDPPYSMTDLLPIIETLTTDVLLIESRVEPVLPEGWEFLRNKRYGTTLVSVMTPTTTEMSTS
jgi:16S rRNA (guanine966-N2)-methyltransferase